MEAPSKIQFSHSEYIEIIRKFAGRICGFKTVMPKSFVILRHDVEFSVHRAFEIAQIEADNDIASTFFFQVSSAAYNPFSIENKNKIEGILALGHSIGLHLYVSHIQEGDIDSLEKEAAAQIKLFETGLGIDCSVFSFHRPQKWLLELRQDKLFGLINAYGKTFFEYSSDPTKIKYIADSQHMWKYGYPFDYLEEEKIQILFHPDEWSEHGTSNDTAFFQELINENKRDFSNVLDNETKNFSLHKAFIK